MRELSFADWKNWVLQNMVYENPKVDNKPKADSALPFYVVL